MKSLQLLLVLAALVLALLAMVVRSPKDRSHTVVDVAELARVIEQEDDHITADELATELMTHRTHWRIIDLRDSVSYREYHIPGAERTEMSAFVTEQLIKTDTVLVYSDGGLHAVQAWMLLRARGYMNVFSLLGGLQEWNDEIRFPRLSDSLSTEQKEFLSRRALFFEGEAVEEKTDKPVTKPTIKHKSEEKPVKKPLREEEKLRNEC